MTSIMDEIAGLQYYIPHTVPIEKQKEYFNALQMYQDKHPWLNIRIDQIETYNDRNEWAENKFIVSNYTITRLKNNNPEVDDMEIKTSTAKRPTDYKVVGDGHKGKWGNKLETIEPDSDQYLEVPEDMVAGCNSALYAFRKKHNFKPRFATAPHGGGIRVWRLKDGPGK